jgi:hypothetical protein
VNVWLCRNLEYDAPEYVTVKIVMAHYSTKFPPGGADGHVREIGRHSTDWLELYLSTSGPLSTDGSNGSHFVSSIL